MTARKPAAHGTNSGYAAHLRKQEEPCNPCRDAHAAYWADYKETNPAGAAGAIESSRRHTKARNAAFRRLAEAHPEQFKVFLAEELQAERERAAGGGLS